jgi:hypothetical protein
VTAFDAAGRAAMRVSISDVGPAAEKEESASRFNSS